LSFLFFPALALFFSFFFSSSDLASSPSFCFGFFDFFFVFFSLVSASGSLFSVFIFKLLS